MFFRPVGQTGAPITDEEPGPEETAPPPGDVAGEPRIAVFDGLPLEQHHHLEGRLIVDDPDSWAAEIPADRRYHGTMIASLIVHGDLGEGEPRLERPVYVRPVLKPDGWDRRWESMPHDTLAVDLIHRAFRRLFGDEGVAPDVMVVNLSIGDRSRPFDHLVSPFARLVDWLAWEHKLLVVISAGNHPEPIELSQRASDLEPEELQREFWKAIKHRAHLQRILAPAEAINALTIGAEHRDACRDYDPGYRIDAAANGDDETLPSPITRWGPGPGRAMKPDLLFPGGRQLYTEEPGNRLRPSHARAREPGQKVAAPATPPDLGRTCYEVGTSNAAALASRTAGQLLEVLPEIVEGFDPQIDRRFLAPLLKTFVVHGAAWGRGKHLCQTLLDADERKHLGRFLGFGFVDPARVLGCTAQRVTLVTWGTLEAGQADVYTVPLPFGLSGVPGFRRLITTLAWLSPINPRDRRYRKADLWVSPDPKQFDLRGDLGIQRSEADYHAAMRGTVHHEVWEGDRAAAFAEDDELAFQVNCREHAGKLDEPIPYGLLVTLEVAPELDVEIYNEVRAKVRARVRV